MPAWNMPDRQIWQLVAYIRHLPDVAAMTPRQRRVAQPRPRRQITDIMSDRPRARAAIRTSIARWSKTRMANVVRDPRNTPTPSSPTSRSPIPSYFHEGRHRLRLRQQMEAALLQESRRRLFPAAGAVGRHAQIWRPYFVPNGADWWAPFYPPDNMQRPTGPLCDGCHSVNYNIETKTVTEWNVGCEKCHGPGERARAAKPSRATS